MKKLLIYSAATKGYEYALAAQAHKVIANLLAASRIDSEWKIYVVLVTNKDECIREAQAVYASHPGIEVIPMVDARLGEGLKNYEAEAQLLIAQMRTMATSRARALDVDFVWSLDSDVLPPHNALRCMLSMLEFDAGYYGVAFCPYPSQGGGFFLGGRGSSRDNIFPNAHPDEKTIPKELKQRASELEAYLKNSAGKPEADLVAARKEIREIYREIRSLPSDKNVFARNAKQWRQRGWFDEAYPAIGKGAVVPVDWTGFGCILMGREALASCDWFGYDGGGTEDLYVNYHRWTAAGIRMCAIPHCVCDHVIRHRSIKGKLVHIHSYHEQHGECVGHLRQKNLPWYSHVAGEAPSPSNDGGLHDMLPVKSEPLP